MAWKPKPWTEDEMKRAELVHGPDRMHSDTYRLHLPNDDPDKPGKMLDVPGWFVGDPEMVKEKQRAANIIRDRVHEKWAESVGEKRLI